MNNYELNQECEAIVELVMREVNEYGGDVQDLLHQVIDNHESVIYTHQAGEICQHCDTSDGEGWINDIGGYSANDYSTVVTQLAYATIYTKCSELLSEQLEEA